MTRRALALRAAIAGAALVTLAGCGGGGDGGGSADDGFTPGPVAAAPVDAAAAAPTDALYGSPPAPDDVVASLPGYDEMGSPRDVFVPIVSDETGTQAPDAAPSTGSGPSEPASPNSVPPPVTPVNPGAPGVTPAPGATTAPTGTQPAAPSAPRDVAPLEGFEADFDIGGEPVVARMGDSIPPETQQFTVATIGRSAVVLKLNGGLLPDGSDTITLKLGQSVTLVNQTTKTTYKLRLLEVRKT